jgi:spore germination protein
MIKVLLVLALLASTATAQSIHQREYEKHERSIEATVTSSAPSYKRVRTNALSKQSYGFHPYWASDTISNHYRWDLLSTIAYFGAELDAATGNISATNFWRTSTVIDSAHAHGVDVHLTAILFSQHDALLGVPARRTNAIVNLIALAKERNAVGINIDFEAVPSHLRDSVTAFVRELRLTAGPEFAIVLDLPPVDWSDAFDVVELQRILDHFFLMAYDYHWQSGPTAGPIAPLGGTGLSIQNSIARYLNDGIDLGKTILGLPWYGYDWPTVSEEIESQARGEASSLTTFAAMRNAEVYGRRLDQPSLSPSYVYTAPESVIHQVWYEDTASLLPKYQYGIQQNMAGIGYWAISYAAQVPGMWNAIAAALGTASVAESADDTNRFYRIPEGAESVVMFDVTGRIVSDASRSGMYFVRFTYEGREQMIKLFQQ